MNDKKLKVLKMVEEKKITVEEAMELLKILEKKEAKKEGKKGREKENRKEAKKDIELEFGFRKNNQPQKEEAVVQNAEIVKISENEYEILPKRVEKLSTKKGIFSNLFSLRKLVIRVEEHGKTVVNLKIPLSIVMPFLKGGFRIAQEKSKEFKKYISMVNPVELENYLASDYRGPLVDVYDAEDEEHVFIGIE